MPNTYKVSLCWPNRIDEATVVGDDWASAFPVTNVQNRVFARKARTNDASDNGIEIVLPRYRNFGVVALAAHNLSTSATWRVRGYEDTGLTTLLHDSGTLDGWPALYTTAELEWENDNFWSGKPNDDERGLFTPLSIYFLPTEVIGQSLRIDLSDSTNPDGYLSIGRVFVGSVWQPDVNMSYGSASNQVIGTTTDEAIDGTEYFDRKRPKRTFSFKLDQLEADEAFNQVAAMRRVLGVDGEVLAAPDLVNNTQQFARRFIGRLLDPDAIEQPYLDNYTTQISVQEIL